SPWSKQFARLTLPRNRGRRRHTVGVADPRLLAGRSADPGPVLPPARAGGPPASGPGRSIRDASGVGVGSLGPHNGNRSGGRSVTSDQQVPAPTTSASERSAITSVSWAVRAAAMWALCVL